MDAPAVLASADYWIGYFSVPVVALLVAGFVVLAVARGVRERRQARDWQGSTLTVEELERPVPTPGVGTPERDD